MATTDGVRDRVDIRLGIQQRLDVLGRHDTGRSSEGVDRLVGWAQDHAAQDPPVGEHLELVRLAVAMLCVEAQGRHPWMARLAWAAVR
jgi:hypothetical protein